LATGEATTSPVVQYRGDNSSERNPILPMPHKDIVDALPEGWERDLAKVGLIRPTCVATMLSAGHAENALPQSATATVNCRNFPGVAPDLVKVELLAVANCPALEIRYLDAARAGPASELNERIQVGEFYGALERWHRILKTVAGR
jgi:acetylornithine deacetylase/succinyl-diaminopimelate desuccinylase-like protein